MRRRTLSLLLAVAAGVAPTMTSASFAGSSSQPEAFNPPPHTDYNGPSSTRIGVIADSIGTTIAFNNAWPPLRKFDYAYDAAGCRRTYAPSCKNPPPLTAVATMQRYQGQWGSLLVMLTGYNDMSYSFPEAVDAVMAEAARQGIPQVMWLTLRTADVRCVPLSYRSTATSFRDNNLVLLQKSRQYGGRLVVADWATHSQRYGSDPNYVSPDGVHMYPVAGSYALSQYVADSATRVLAGEDITPTCAQAGVSPNTPWTFLRYGMGGIAVADAQRALIARGIYLPTGVTGYFDARTAYAVMTFQRMDGLPAKGHIDEHTARALGLIGAPWPTVVAGATGAATVRRIEAELIERGIFVRGGVDGVFDVWLKYAVMTFQRHNGLTVTGIVDIATASLLGLTLAPAPGAVWTAVSYGSTGLLVARAQQALVSRGIALPTGVTGTFDVPTLYAVRTFQRYNGLPVTGVVDVETARKLGLLDAAANPVAGWVNLGLGAAGPSVRAAEECLMAAAVQVRDGPDGTYKLDDFYAVSTWQRWRSGGLPITGRIDLATAAGLGVLAPDACSAATSMLATASPGPTTTTTSSTTSTTTTSTTSTTVPTTTTSTTTTSSTTTTTTTTSSSTTTSVPDPTGPEATVAPETTAEPDTTLEPETTVGPETTLEPETTVGPETTPAAEEPSSTSAP
jgi:peptidoglycan hydrolase-like protein with peptidoglycan-binding domain